MRTHARGIGAAVARRLAGDGLAVGVIDLDEADCADTAEAITSVGGAALAVAADVADEAAVTAAVRSSTSRAGRWTEG
ncbi:SDR family NAD(P)-dependent oxidoreductase [Streptomyces wuyuanensis]|uniref:SDR family NAD(P)-dependent oxidoreductase n=1 Tax=Streptomyces wuyuanensis TaxID=1196353 RepID=UPI003428A73A